MGATNEPWNAPISKMRKCFEKFMHFPTEHYADKFVIWQTALRNRLGLIPNFEFSSLVEVNLDYSVAAILNAIDQVLTTSRMNRYDIRHQEQSNSNFSFSLARLDIYPLKAEEFMVAMSTQESPLERTVQSLCSFYNMCTISNRKNRMFLRLQYIEKYEKWIVDVGKLTGEEKDTDDDDAATKKAKKKKS